MVQVPTVPRVQLSKPVSVSENAAINFFNALPKQKTNALDAINQGLNTFIKAEQSEALVNIKQQELEQRKKQNQIQAVLKQQDFIKNNLEIQKKKREVQQEAQTDMFKGMFQEMVAKGDPQAVDFALQNGTVLSSVDYKQTIDSLQSLYPNDSRLWTQGERIKTEKLRRETQEGLAAQKEEVNDFLLGNGIEPSDVVNGKIERDSEGKGYYKITTKDGNNITIPRGNGQAENAFATKFAKNMSKVNELKKRDNFNIQNKKLYEEIESLEKDIGLARSDRGFFGTSDKEIQGLENKKAKLLGELKRRAKDAGLFSALDPQVYAQPGSSTNLSPEIEAMGFTRDPGNIALDIGKEMSLDNGQSFEITKALVSNEDIQIKGKSLPGYQKLKKSIPTLTPESYAKMLAKKIKE